MNVKIYIRRGRTQISVPIFQRNVKNVASVTLVFVKEKNVEKKYGKYVKNAKTFNYI